MEGKRLHCKQVRLGAGKTTAMLWSREISKYCDRAESKKESPQPDVESIAGGWEIEPELVPDNQDDDADHDSGD